MKISVSVEWRKKDEPESDLEWIITTALKAHGFTVGRVFVQGDYLEDKPKIPFSDGDRLPHDLIASEV